MVERPPTHSVTTWTGTATLEVIDDERAPHRPHRAGSRRRARRLPDVCRSGARAHRRGAAAGVPRSLLVRRMGRLRGVRRRAAPVGRGAPGDRAHRERARGSAVGELPGPEQRLRGLVAARARRGRRQPAADEPRPRDRRRRRVRGRRARGQLLRAVRGGARVGPQAVDLGAGPRLGERDRQRPRVRRRLHALRRARGQRVRPGGGAPGRRAGADGHRARSRTAVPGTSTSAASGPRSTASSSSRTSASSRRWASG